MIMVIRRIRGFLIPFVILFAILGVATLLIGYGKGYRLDFGNNRLKSTGLILATSDPIGAQIYVNGILRTATNNSVNVDPGWYTVRITREGFIPWEKQVRVQGEVVARADAFLFPTSPSLSPLTATGIVKPLLSPDGTKIAYIVPFPAMKDATAAFTPSAAEVKNAGIWIYELIDRPLGLNRDPKHIASFESNSDPDNMTMIWSPDANQLLVADTLSIRLYQTNRLDEYKIISASYESILKEWQDDTRAKDRAKLAAFKPPIIDMATRSAKIIAFSPDETKLFYEATASATIPQVIVPALLGTNPTKEERTIHPGKLYVYDSREDKNYFLLDKKELPAPKPTPLSKSKSSSLQLPTSNFLSLTSNVQLPTSIRWFPTNRHLLFMLQGKIDVLEYDRTNWITVYSGPFTDGFMAPWPNGSRIIIMTNLNPGTQPLPNLYTVNLR
ncbi:PEGA domain-containing protein [Candidatus Gottesmanbacteria bacterium]|nr:PEGA domain-containing protein [Candidatus Gottesmanbacteria bacterium]